MKGNQVWRIVIFFVLGTAFGFALTNWSWERDVNLSVTGQIVDLGTYAVQKEASLNLRGQASYTVFGFKGFSGSLTLDDKLRPIKMDKYSSNLKEIYTLDQSPGFNGCLIPFGILETKDFEGDFMIGFYDQTESSLSIDLDKSSAFVYQAQAQAQAQAQSHAQGSDNKSDLATYIDQFKNHFK